ncbi:hypothetical protein [Rhodopila sp.]|uniref:hypothetical protein n=1 Tax=Rhodopila sp. TaxID=2480087 RepID=UPI002D129F4B|nr:hypothetical protein [Rhodopila sp.]HVZ07743.1 hypothetical protein [Rhodopila sp.]
MTKTTIAVLGAAALTFASGAALAQSAAISGQDYQTLQSCQAMQPDVMEKDTACMALKAAHPGLLSGRSAADTAQPNGTSANPSVGPGRAGAGAGAGAGTGAGAGGGGAGAGAGAGR